MAEPALRLAWSAAAAADSDVTHAAQWPVSVPAAGAAYVAARQRSGCRLHHMLRPGQLMLHAVQWPGQGFK